MKVLFAASEAHPFIQTGGLGDVAYSLPKALNKAGVDVRVILPKYSDIPPTYKDKMQFISSFEVSVGWRNQYCGLLKYVHEGVTFYFLDNEDYYKRSGIYGFFDDGERYSFFCRGILEAIEHMEGFTPDIIHCNDWHTGMVPVLLEEHYKKLGKLQEVKTIYTIHNLKYQGLFPKEILNDLLSLPEEYYNENSLKYYSAVSFMKGGINYANVITTVSETYVQEIKDPFFGEGLHGLLSSKSESLYGIINGIDYDMFDPKTDKDICYNYDIKSIKNKAKNKAELQSLLKLPVSENTPVIGIVSRLVKQKGFDLVAHIIEELLCLDIQLVVLGTGDDDYQDLFEYYASIYPSRLSCNISFDSVLAKKIYAGSDMFLMPSLFEPCGIGQLIALKYGTVPIVRETGGLKDTVIPYNEYTEEGTGFTFSNYNAHEMLSIIKYALECYGKKEKWEKLMENCMYKNNSWDNSANKYKDLYESI